MHFPLKPYYTISSSLLLRNPGSNPLPENWRLNILIDTESVFTPELYRTLNGLQNDYIISLSADLLQKTITNELLARLYLLNTLNISLTKKSIVPVIAEIKTTGAPAAINAFATYFSQQGFPDIKFPFFNGLDTPQKNQLIDNCQFTIVSVDSEDLINISPLTGTNNAGYNISIILFTGKAGDITTFNSIATGLDKVLFKVSENEVVEFYTEKDEFLFEENLWKKRTLVYRDFLLLSKEIQSKEYFGVLDWYRNEYEILPSWYKRLGHIIKVIMGKRTFRSLFDDKVKKHID